MRKMISSVLAMALCASFMLACGGAGAGAPCVVTDEGAKACRSGICLRVTCTAGGSRDVCAGDPCTTTPCSSTDDQCVALGNGASFCVPNSVCR